MQQSVRSEGTREIAQGLLAVRYNPQLVGASPLSQLPHVALRTATESGPRDRGCRPEAGGSQEGRMLFDHPCGSSALPASHWSADRNLAYFQTP
jgi:hypothetical protein